jgi:hypothetical protein
MGKKTEYTPKSRVRNTLRQLFLRSRERAKCLKLSNYSCVKCGKKQSKRKGNEIKVQVHHLDGIVWDKMLNMVYETLLCSPDKMICLCKECHDKEHHK